MEHEESLKKEPSPCRQDAWWIGTGCKSKNRRDSSAIEKLKLETIDEGDEALEHKRNAATFHSLVEKKESFVERFFADILPTKGFHGPIDHNIYICLFHEGACYNVAAGGSHLQARMPVRYSGGFRYGLLPIYNVFWYSFLRGFALRRPKYGCEDVRRFTVPQVRKVLCKKQSFINQELQNVFRTIISNLDKCGSKDNRETQDMLKTLLPERQNILWSIEDRDAFLRDVCVERKVWHVCSGTVFCLMRGEPAALKGVPVSASYKDHAVKENLEFYWHEQILAPKIMRADQSKTQ